MDIFPVIGMVAGAAAIVSRRRVAREIAERESRRRGFTAVEQANLEHRTTILIIVVGLFFLSLGWLDLIGAIGH